MIRHPVRNDEWKAKEQTVVQPRGDGARRKTGAEHGAPAEQKMGQRAGCCASIDAIANAQVVNRL
jgi:hypothetical protein